MFSLWLMLVSHLWIRVMTIFEQSLAHALDMLTPTGKTDEPMEKLLQRVREALQVGQTHLLIVPQLLLSFLFLAVPWFRSFIPVTFPVSFLQGLIFNLIIMRTQYKPRSSYPRRRAVGVAPFDTTTSAKPGISRVAAASESSG
jgi:hypothetical protein